MSFIDTPDPATEIAAHRARITEIEEWLATTDELFAGESCSRAVSIAEFEIMLCEVEIAACRTALAAVAA